MNRIDWITALIAIVWIAIGIWQVSIGDTTEAMISFLITTVLGISMIVRNWGVWNNHDNS